MKKYLLGLSAILILGLSSCKKDSDDSTPANDKKTSLSAKKWRTSTTTDGVADVISDCAKDNTQEFKTDGKLVMSEDANVCPGRPATSEGKWAVNNDQSKLTLTNPSGSSIEFSFVSFTATKFEVSYKATVGSKEVTRAVTYTAI